MGKIINALRTDSTTQSLFIVNILIIVMALIEGWPAAKFLIVYWAQSVVIGFYTFLKLLTYKRESKIKMLHNLHIAMFFSYHYGFFHFIYLIFILAMRVIETNSLNSNLFVNFSELFSTGFIILLIILFINHGFSFIKYKHEKKTKSIQMIFYEPYSRIVPMHLTLMFGFILVIAGFGIVVLFIFSFIKLYLDLIAHINEHSKKENKIKKILDLS